MARIRYPDLCEKSYPSGKSKRKRDRARAYISPADTDPHPVRKFEVACRDLESKSALDAYERRRTLGNKDRRPRAHLDGNRLFRKSSVGNRRNAPGCRRVLSSHRTLATRAGCEEQSLVDESGDYQRRRARQ